LADKLTCFTVSVKQLWYFTKQGGVLHNKEKDMKMTFIPSFDRVLLQISSENEFVKTKLPTTKITEAEYV